MDTWGYDVGVEDVLHGRSGTWRFERCRASANRASSSAPVSPSQRPSARNASAADRLSTAVGSTARTSTFGRSCATRSGFRGRLASGVDALHLPFVSRARHGCPTGSSRTIGFCRRILPESGALVIQHRTSKGGDLAGAERLPRSRSRPIRTVSDGTDCHDLGSSVEMAGLVLFRVGVRACHHQ